MKTTLNIHDELLARAKRHANATGKPLRAVVEDGLRLALSASSAAQSHYKLPDLRFGDADAPDPLAGYAWPELRDLIYALSASFIGSAVTGAPFGTPFGEPNAAEHQ